MRNAPHLDQSLPCYQRSTYRENAARLTFLDNIYIGRDAWSNRDSSGTVTPASNATSYLVKGKKEPNYDIRFKLSPFKRHFASALKRFVGLIFSNGIVADIPDSLQSDWANLDLSGNPANVVLPNLALLSQRLGHCLVMVDHQGFDPNVRSQLDYTLSGRRPYWRVFSSRQMINWDTEIIDEQERLTFAVFAIRRRLKVGVYGEAHQDCYLQLHPDSWYLWTIETDREGDSKPILQDSGPLGQIVNGVYKPYDYLPIFSVYGGERVGAFESRCDHDELADINLTHYQTQSEHIWKMRLCSFPIYVRIGDVSQSPLIIGPDALIDVPMGGGFSIAEPLATSLEQSRLELERMERNIDFLTAEYLIKPSDREAATTAAIKAEAASSGLHLFAAQLAAGVNNILAFHAQMKGVSDVGRVRLNTKFFEQTAQDPQLLLAFLQWAEFLDRHPTLNEQQLQVMDRVRSQFLPEGKDNDDH